MKENEIGHFPWSEQHKQYTNLTCRYDKETDRIVWEYPFEMLGVVQILQVKSCRFIKCVYDLQTADDCYSADLLDIDYTLDGEEYNNAPVIGLMGSGWAELGFPFNDEKYTGEGRYESSRGQYAYLRGKARDRFIEICDENNKIPILKDVCTKVDDNFVLINHKECA